MSSSPLEEIASFKVQSLECDLIQQTFNMEVSARLGVIACNQSRKEGNVNIISTPLKAEEGAYLFVVKFIQVNRSSPEFHSKYQSCEAKLSLEFTSLNVVLHQEGLQSLLKFTTELQMQIEDLRSNAGVAQVMSVPSFEGGVRRLSSVAESVVSGVRSSSKTGMIINLFNGSFKFVRFSSNFTRD